MTNDRRFVMPAAGAPARVTFPPVVRATLSNGARYLFTQEFRLHIFGAQYAYPAPILMATLSGIAEIVFPVLLVLGLFTRFAAVALLAMIAVIQLTVPEGWAFSRSV